MVQSFGNTSSSASDQLFVLDFNRRPSPDRSCTREFIRAAVVVLGFGVLIALNVLTVVLPSLLKHRCGSAEMRKLVAPLCVPCEDGTRERDATLMFDDEAGGRVCCPTSHVSLVGMLDQIYSDVLREKTANRYATPSDDGLDFNDLQVDDARELILRTNYMKPLAHLTGLDAQSGAGDRREDDKSLQVVTTRSSREPYKIVLGGQIIRLIWGLEVSVNGTYRLYSFVNFYFQNPSSVRSPDDRTEVATVPVIHQLIHFDVISKTEEVLVQRNQSVSSRHSDGLPSFLMTSARLTVGDVILVRASHPSALVYQDGWHTEGLVLVQ